MRTTILWVMIIASGIILPGCKKNNKTPVYTSSKMNGNWIWMGYTYSSTIPPEPSSDVFAQFGVSVIDATSVIVLGDILKFESIDPVTKSISFYYSRDQNPMRPNYRRLIYDPTNNVMTSSSQATTSYGGGGGSVSNAEYKPNPLLKDYITGITGTKPLSGTGYDTLIGRPKRDSMFSINVTVHFTAINDSTITFDKDILGIGDNTLHYKVTDYTAKTITFQTFHWSYEWSMLTYNYETRQISFEQRDYQGMSKRRVILQ